MTASRRIAPCLYVRRESSYVFRFTLDGKRKEMGLGAIQEDDSPIREEVATLLLKVAAGIDPIEERDQQRKQERDARRVAKIKARGITVRRSLRLWFDAACEQRKWSRKYMVNVVRSIEVDPPAWLLDLPIADLKFSDVVRALGEMTCSQQYIDRFRWRLDWAMEMYMNHGSIDKNPAGVRRIMRGRFE